MLGWQVSNEEVHALHKKLLSLNQQMLESKNDLEESIKQMNVAVQKNARLEHHVKNFKDRSMYLERIQVLQKKKMYLVSENGR